MKQQAQKINKVRNCLAIYAQSLNNHIKMEEFAINAKEGNSFICALWIRSLLHASSLYFN